MTSVTHNRLAGFYRSCEAAGIKVPDDYVRAARFHDPATSARVTGELLALKRPPTCIIYPDDICVLGGRSELESRGLSIPEDVSVAGYDGALLSEALRPPLTTVRQDTDSLGKRAATLLVEAVENPKTHLPQQELIPGQMIPGGTVRKLG
jgi:LacI family transcriptional regulator